MNSKQIEELRKLKTLLNEGIITKEEFIEARDELLHTEKGVQSSKTVTNSSDNPHLVSMEEDSTFDVSFSTDNDDQAENAISTVNDDIPVEKTVSSLAENTATAKPKKDKFVPIFLGVLVAVIGIVILLNYVAVEKVKKELPGRWTYAESYKADSDSPYDADFESTITFSDDGSVAIKYEKFICQGKWSISTDGTYTEIKVTDYEITKGHSSEMEQIIENLEYHEYSDGVNLYWYEWDGEHITNWHYYKKAES